MLLVSLASAQNRSYTVREGDTLSGIADKLGVSQKALKNANGLDSPHKLRVGKKLIVPGGPKIKEANRASSGSTYTVRSGDHDGKIARRFGLTVEKLHALNPGVNFRKLQIGEKLRIGGSATSSRTKRNHSSSELVSAPVSGGYYTVRAGDNDNTIAKKVGISVSKLHSLNPGIKWTRIQPGDKLRASSQQPSSSAQTMRLASSHTGASKTQTGRITTNDVTIRRGPSARSGRIATVAAGTKVAILEGKNGWFKLRFPKGTVGWVKDDFVTKGNGPVAKSEKKSSGTTLVAAHNATAAERILDKAYSYRGVRYRYGGTSRSGIDCSGFTSSVYRSLGYKLPRTAAEQSRIGSAVSKGSLKAGDLVFFRTNRSRRINHVGIYIGGGKFIHASSGGGKVQTNSLSEGYYNNRYAGGRRIVKGKAEPLIPEIIAQESEDSTYEVETESISPPEGIEENAGGL